MPTRCQVLHDWIRHLHRLLPHVHATRTTTLAVMTLGILWSGTVTLLAAFSYLSMTTYDMALTADIAGNLVTVQLTHSEI